MRIGSNPAANQIIDNSTTHRIIIPVYVPNLDGYFEKGLEITKLCVESVVRTRHSESFFTVVNNGSCEAVTTYLQSIYAKGEIDQLIHFKENKGKIDAVIPVARTCSEPLVTISDGDVLFKTGWMQAIEDVYHNFPEAGMVSPVPNPLNHKSNTGPTFLGAFISRKLSFGSVVKTSDVEKFLQSIGRNGDDYLSSVFSKKQFFVQNSDFRAIVGCGHFVSTIRKEVFKLTPNFSSQLAYSSKADKEYIDIPLVKSGYWRLATAANYAYHLGNRLEEWHLEEFNLLNRNADCIKTNFKLDGYKNWTSFFPLRIQEMLFRIFYNLIIKSKLKVE